MIEAADGRQGLDAVHAERPDLVITDVLMPVMDGYELVRQLRLDPETATIPVVFYTAHYGEREARALALAGGVSDVLTKPGAASVVLEVVDRVLAGGSSLRAEGAPPFPSDFDREHLRLLIDKVSEKTGDLRAANARLRALINIALDFGSDDDFALRLHTVCSSTRDLFGATYVTLGVLNRTDGRLERLLTCGLETADWLEPRDAVPGLLGMVVSKRRPLRGSNAGGSPITLQLPALHPPIHTFLAVPIVSSGHVYGWICLVGNDGQGFSEEDEHLLMALSGQIGRIYELEREVLERQHADAEVRIERDRARRYLSTAEVILLALDRDGRITLINRKGCDLLGRTEEELIGRDWFVTCVAEPMRDTLRRSFQQLLNGEVSATESSVITASGEVRLIEWRHTVVAEGNGEVAGTFSSGSDITERARAEAEIRQRAQLSALTATIGLSLTEPGSFARALQQCTEVLVTHLDAAFARIWVLNDSERMLHLQASAGLYTDLVGPHGRVPLGQPPIGRIARDRRPHITNTLGDDAYVQDGEWARREGMIAFAGHPLIADGRVVGVMAIFARHSLSDTVVSTLSAVADHIALGIERHRAGEALRIAEERMRFALQTAGVGIWDMNYATGVLQWSETLEAQYGMQPGTFGGTFDAFIERVHTDDRASVTETFRKAARSGADFSVQNRPTPESGLRWLSGAGRIHLDEYGAPQRGVGISLDVTERRPLEEQYQQAQRIEAIGRLAGGVAHDFNNLLTVILGHCELLLDDFPPDDPRRPAMAEIQKAGESAAGLTVQLLAFSRNQVDPTVLDLNIVLIELQGTLRPLIRKDIEIVLDLAPGPQSINADRGQLEQVVINLAVNAQDATAGSGTVTIRTASAELDDQYAHTHFAVLPGPYVALIVTDTGTGMTAEVLARLFEPFFTTREFGKGAGLGLATVHRIVTRAGGSVTVASEVGAGSSFTVYLPAMVVAKTVNVPPAVLSRRIATETILVVEDADGLRELARKLLQREGYTVLVAANADEAILVFERNASIDILLTDVVMPGANGPELTKQLIARRPDLKVIYMSGYTEETFIRQGVLTPGLAFLHKPFSSDALARKIRESLDA